MHDDAEGGAEGAGTSKQGFKCCAMCMRICFETHGDQGRAEAEEFLAAPSFVKIVLACHLSGSKFLRIPVMFMEEHGYKIGERVTLRGPTGYECQAPLCYNKGYGLRSGFAMFVAYHEVEAGDYLLFTLVANSDFQIKVYNKYGCERTLFLGLPYTGRVPPEGKPRRKSSAHAEGPRRDEEARLPKRKLRERRNSAAAAAAAEPRLRRSRRCIPAGEEEDDARDVRGLGDPDLQVAGTVDKTRKVGTARTDPQSKRCRTDGAAAGDPDGKRRRLEAASGPGCGAALPPGLDNGGGKRGHDKERQRMLMLKLLRRSFVPVLSDRAGPRNLCDGAETSVREDGKATSHDELDSPLERMKTQESKTNLERPDRPTGWFRTIPATAEGSPPPSEVERDASGKEGPRVAGATTRPTGAAVDSRPSSGVHDDGRMDPEELLKVLMAVSDAEDSPDPTSHAGGGEDRSTMKVRQGRTSKSPEEARREQLAAAEACKTSHPSTTIHITRPSSTLSFAYFPKAFARKWFPARTKNVLLMDNTGRRWPVLWYHYNKKSRFGGGWRQFVRENHLVEGDLCVLELVNPVKVEFAVHIFRLADFVHAPRGHSHGPRAEGAPADDAEEGWGSQGKPGAGGDAEPTRLPLAEAVKYPSARSRYGVEDVGTDSEDFVPTAAQFFASLRPVHGRTQKGPDTESRCDASVDKRTVQEPVAATTAPLTKVRTVKPAVSRSTRVDGWVHAPLAAANALELKNPHTAVVMKASHVEHQFCVYLPAIFPMPKRTSRVILLDAGGGGERYPATWLVTTSGRRLSAGWKGFAFDHELAVGDVCVFEVTNPINLALTVHIFRDNTADGDRDDRDRPRPKNPSKGLRKVDKRVFVRLDSVLEPPVLSPSTGTGRPVPQSSEETNPERERVSPEEDEPASQRSNETDPQRKRISPQAEAMQEECKVESECPSFSVEVPESAADPPVQLAFPEEVARKVMPHTEAGATLVDSTGELWPATWAGAPENSRDLPGLETYSRAHPLAVGDVCGFELLTKDPLTFTVETFEPAADAHKPKRRRVEEAHPEEGRSASPGVPGHPARNRFDDYEQAGTVPTGMPDGVQGRSETHKVGTAGPVPRRTAGTGALARRRPKNCLARAIRAVVRNKNTRIRDNGRKAAVQSASCKPAQPTADAMGFTLRSVKSEPVVDSWPLDSAAPPSIMQTTAERSSSVCTDMERVAATSSFVRRHPPEVGQTVGPSQSWDAPARPSRSCNDAAVFYSAGHAAPARPSKSDNDTPTSCSGRATPGYADFPTKGGGPLVLHEICETTTFSVVIPKIEPTEEEDDVAQWPASLVRSRPSYSESAGDAETRPSPPTVGEGFVPLPGELSDPASGGVRVKEEIDPLVDENGPLAEDAAWWSAQLGDMGSFI